MDFDIVRAAFGGQLTQPQVDGIKVILDEWQAMGDGDGDERHLAYVLATARHETAGTMQPIYERGPRSYFDKYEPGTQIGKALGNTVKGDGYRFRGRGFVQLTGRANYHKASVKANVDLLADPDLALKPDTAAYILIYGCINGWFTGKRLADYLDFLNMRRVVNGTDKASLIATYAESFYKALQAKPLPPAANSNTSTSFPPPIPQPVVLVPQAGTGTPTSPRGWAVLASLVGGMIYAIAKAAGWAP